MSLLPSIHIQRRQHGSSFYLKRGTQQKNDRNCKRYLGFFLIKRDRSYSRIFSAEPECGSRFDIPKLSRPQQMVTNPTGWPNESGFQKWICLHSELLIRSQILWHRLQILRVKQQMLPKKIGEEGYYSMHLLIFHRKIFFEGQNRGSPNDINHTTLASANVVQSNT